MNTATHERKFPAIEAGMVADIDAMPLLSSLLPFRFGASVIDHVDTSCANCGKTLESDTIRGEFEILAGGQAAGLKAYGLCCACFTITPIESRFHNDGMALHKGPSGWTKRQWTTAPGKPVVIGFVQQRWQQLLPPSLVVTIFFVWWMSQ